MLHTLWPREPGRTEVVCEWFFEPATMAGEGFDPGDAVSFWDQVNREDWHVCELTQRGMSSRRFQPGRYTTQEGDVHEFDVMVAQRYLEALKARERDRRLWQVEGSVSLQYDDNVVLEGNVVLLQ